jgi:hypothetical protein
MIERMGDIDEGDGPPGEGIGMHVTGPEQGSETLSSMERLHMP